MPQQSHPSAVNDDGTDIGLLRDLVGYRLRRASSAMGADFARAMAETGVRQVHFGMLAVIKANPGIGQGALGRALGIQRANMVPLVSELVERGLIDRRAAPTDRRAFALTLTSGGEQLLQECATRIAAHEDRMLAALTTTEKAQLLAVLEKMENN